MWFFAFAIGVRTATLMGSWLLLGQGRRLGQRLREQEGKNALTAIQGVERSILWLAVLLLAFAFQGALHRYDQRQRLTLQEAAAISTVGRYLDFLPALDRMFEASVARDGANRRHPPHLFFAALFSVGLAASLVAGFGMASSAASASEHMIAFATLLSDILCVITDLELPRIGLIRLDTFDHILEDVLQELNSHSTNAAVGL